MQFVQVLSQTSDSLARSNNVSIMLVRLRMGVKTIKRAILEVDDEVLTLDDLVTLSRLIPSGDEVERLKAFDGNVEKLAKPDQYFREISTIPRLQGRFEAMVFRRRYVMILAEIMPDLGVLRSATLELRGSERLRAVLGVVLAVGNAMNGGTFRGGAAGFRLDALVKVSHMQTHTSRTSLKDQLGETRTAKGSQYPTLLHYLATKLLQVNPVLMLFLDELPSLEAAARRT